MTEHQGLSKTWRGAAVDRWYDAQDHVGQADTDPQPYVEAVADAAVRVVLEALYAKASMGSNLDDGLWCETFKALLKEALGVPPEDVEDDQ